ncbi:MAG: hypothetical protein Q6370_026185 [Candidatus Sigynarchaeota archaeon]
MDPAVQHSYDMAIGLVLKNKYKKAGQELGNAIKRLSPSQHEEFFPLFEEIILAAGTFFMKGVYQGMVDRCYIPSRIAQFEESFIRRYCLVPDEQLLKVFLGKLEEPDCIIKGWIYVTTFRIIVSGIRVEKKKGGAPWFAVPIASLPVKLIADHARSSKAKAMQSMHDAFANVPGNVLDYGYVYPYLTNYDLQRHRNHDISYWLDFDYLGGKKPKIIQIQIKLSVLKALSQNTKEFKAWRCEVADYLYNLFSSASQQSGGTTA